MCVPDAPTPLRLGASPLTSSRGWSVGPPPRPRAAAISGPAVREVPTSQQWTTGRRQLTDELATQRRVRDDDLGVFASHVIHSGGHDGAGNLTMLHPHAQVRGCARVQEGLYYGGDLAHAASLVREGRAHEDDFLFFKGRYDWRPAELRGELELGEWALAPRRAQAAAAALAVIRRPPPPPPTATVTATAMAMVAPVGSATAPDTPGDEHARRRHAQRHDCWAGVVAALVADEGLMADDVEAGGALAVRWRDGLRAWLRVRPLQQEEVAQLEAIRARGRAAHALQAAEPPPWRTREDWKADVW